MNITPSTPNLPPTHPQLGVTPPDPQSPIYLGEGELGVMWKSGGEFTRRIKTLSDSRLSLVHRMAFAVCDAGQGIVTPQAQSASAINLNKQPKAEP
jgi:hypothetical protein